jgi:hypothetical protein
MDAHECGGKRYRAGAEGFRWWARQSPSVSLCKNLPAHHAIGAEFRRSGARIRSTHRGGGAGHPFTHSRNVGRTGIVARQFLRWLTLHCFAGSKPITFWHQQTKENRTVQNQRATRQGSTGLDKIAQTARCCWCRGRNIRLILLAALMCTPLFIRGSRLMHSILLTEASSITDGPKQEHDGGKNSHFSIESGMCGILSTGVQKGRPRPSPPTTSAPGC